MRRLQLLCALILIAALLAVAAPALAAGATWYVDAATGSDTNDGTSPTTAFKTIQKGIDSAAAGDTVQVAAGAYHERIAIGKALSLQGAQFGVDPVPAGARTGSGESTIDLTGVTVTNPNVLVDIASGVANVTIDGFTLVGSPTFHYADEAVVRGNGNNIAVRNNIVDGYYGIVYQGAGPGLTVERNRITVNKAGLVLQSGGSNVTVSGNKMVPGGSPAADAAGIYMSGVSQVNVSGNTVAGFTNGNGVGGSNYTQVTIAQNTFANNKRGINIWGNTTFVTISQNQVTGSVDRGIVIKGQDIAISNNAVTGGAAFGIEIAKHTLDTVRVTIANNDLTGNAAGALRVDAAVVVAVNAANNWWGSANGPSHAANTFNVGSQGAVASGLANFAPWLTATPPAGASFAPVTNGGNGFASIQAAIDAATAGDTITAAAGTYTESLLVNKSVTLRSAAGAASTILNGNHASERYYMVDIEADNVTVDGLTITNPVFDGSADASGVVTGMSRRSANIRVTNCIIHDMGAAARSSVSFGSFGLNIGPVNGLEIDHNTIYDIRHADAASGSWANGIIVWGNDATDTANNVNIHDNTIYNVSSPAAFDEGIYISSDTTNITIQGNNIHDTGEIGISGNPGQGSGITIRRNQIANCTLAGIRLRSPIADTVTENVISGCATGVLARETVTAATITGNSITGSTAKAVDNQSASVINASGNWLGDNTPAGVSGLAGANVDYTPWLASGADTQPGTPGFQGDFAVLWVDDDSPQSGATGRIQEGVNLVSGSTVNVAAGTYVEVVRIPRALTLVGAVGARIRPDNTTALLDGGSRRPAVYIDSANGVTVRGFEIDGAGGDVHYGIYALNANNVTISNNTIHDIKNATAAPVSDVAGVGILCFGWGQGIGGATIQGNTVFNCGRMGISVCAMQGSGDYKWLACPNTVIRNNTVHNAWQGPTADGGGAVQINAAKSSSIEGNKIYATGLGKQGIYVTGSLGSGNSITLNDVHDNPIGIQVWSAGYNVEFGADVPAAPVVHNNKITNNATMGLGTSDTDPPLLVNAENNWWGSALGPGPVGPGCGDAVSANVDYSPWWSNAAGTATAGQNPDGSVTLGAGSSLQAALDCAAPGATIRLSPGTYTGGIVLNKPVTLIGGPGVIITHGSPAFTVAANDVTIDGWTIDGAGDTTGASGIVVNGGIANLWVRNCEILNWPADGIHLNGAVDGLKIVDNYVHTNGSDGIEFAGAAPTGVVQIYGNSFRSNTGLGINAAAATVPAEYNEWGDIAGPSGSNGDGASSTVDADPWTFGKVYADVVPAPAVVREAENVTVDILLDAASIFGAQAGLTFDLLRLEVVSTVVSGPGYFKGAQEATVAFDNVAGTLSYRCARSAGEPALSGPGIKLLTVTFRAKEIGGVAQTTDIHVVPASVKLGAPNGINVRVDSTADDTLTILGTTSVSGVVDLQGRDDDSGAVVAVAAGASHGWDPSDYTTMAWGAYSFTDMTDDSYAITVSRPLYLTAQATVTVAGDTLVLNKVVLLAGNANNDDKIDVSDLSIIGYDFGHTGGTIYNPNADINGDGQVDILDLVLAAGNYDLTASPWTP